MICPGSNFEILPVIFLHLEMNQKQMENITFQLTNHFTYLFILKMIEIRKAK